MSGDSEPELRCVREAVAHGDLLHPLGGGPTTVDLSRTIASIIGAPAPAPNDPSIANVMGDAPHLVLVLVDGFGMHIVEALPPSSFLRSHVAMELRTVYPSSTAPALTSLITGRWPGEHAVPGWWTHLPDSRITATILPFLERFSGKPAIGFGATAAAAFPAASILTAAGRDAAIVQPRPITGSVYSHYFAGGARELPYESLADAVGRVSARIGAASGPTFTYAYVSIVDTMQHIHGLRTPEVNAAVRAVEEAMAALVSSVAGRARVVVTADHGAIAIDAGARTILDRNDPLLDLLEIPPSGEPRAPLFHARRGREDEFEAMFQRRFGEDFALLDVDAAEGAELFGPRPLGDEARRRIGTHTAVALRERVILYEPANELREMRGFHGGLTRDEMRVPLIVC